MELLLYVIMFVASWVMLYWIMRLEDNMMMDYTVHIIITFIPIVNVVILATCLIFEIIMILTYKKE